MLAHPKTDAQLAVVCDASDFAAGGVLQQWVDETWEPLGYFSTKFSPAEKKYSAFDRELLAIYLTIRHFRHIIEGRAFIVFTDHKPLTFISRLRSMDRQSPRQARHVDFIFQFTTDIRHISGCDNVVADTLSRIESITSGIDFNALAESQKNDSELKILLENGELNLLLKSVMIPGCKETLFCDVSSKNARPFVTKKFRRTVFDSLHKLSHPGINATVKLIAERYVWPLMKKDCRSWARTCVMCQ